VARGLELAGLALVVALAVTWPAESALARWSTGPAALAVVGLLALGGAGDMLAVAAAAAEEAALHAMAARGRRAAKAALGLKRRADHVASIAGDIVGDVSGTVAGAAAALWASAAARGHGWSPVEARAAAVALVAAVTVGLKAALKGVALEHANTVLYLAGYVGHSVWPRARSRRRRR
jgi:CBS domain containing-hemolysin-like protein